MFNVLRSMDAHTLQNLTLDDFNGLMARFATEAAAGGNGGNGGNAVPQVVHAAAGLHFMLLQDCPVVSVRMHGA